MCAGYVNGARTKPYYLRSTGPQDYANLITLLADAGIVSKVQAIRSGSPFSKGAGFSVVFTLIYIAQFNKVIRLGFVGSPGYEGNKV